MDRTEASERELSLREAARLLESALLSLQDAEVLLADSIQRGKLHANVMRWGTEQWDGRKLPGNIHPLETRILRRDLDAWRSARSGPLRPIDLPHA